MYKLFMQAAALVVAIGFVAPASAQPVSTADAAQRIVEQRAFEAVVWGMPAVNFDLMRQEMLKANGKVNQIVYWGKPLDWHNQTLTPNPDSIYLMAFFDTKDVGPMVLEVPPAQGGSINGNIVTLWQMPLEDAGPSGADKGKGGKYLILPPGYAKNVPSGYIPLRSDTFSGYALLRSNLRSHSDADVATSVAYGKRIKFYPLAKAGNPPATVFTDAAGLLFDSTIRYDASLFEGLNRIIQAEPWIERDRAMIDQLRSLGIEKGKPFNPDPATKASLEKGVRAAQAWLEARYDAGFPPFFPGSRWTVPAIPELVEATQSGYANPDLYPVDARGVAYTYAFVGLKRLGAGQFYLISIKDKDGNGFDGGKSYRLTVPANAPVEQYWSATAYDRQTHALIRDVPRASRSSQIAELQRNPDGSADLHFGPQAPAGKDANWIPTKAGRDFEVMFRLYAPTKALFDKSWVLPDIEPVASTGAAPDAKAATAEAEIPVTAENFPRAESDLYFANMVKDAGGPGKFIHRREPAAIDNQTVIRLNRDTLYSAAVFDLDAGPVTVTLPDAGQRFMSTQVIDEDQYTPAVHYGGGSHTLTRQEIGTRYVLVGIRTLVDPADVTDVADVHALQDAMKIEQPGGSGTFEVPKWDQASQKKVREALLALASTLPDTKGMFGPKSEVDPVRRLIGSASAWGGNPEKDALYLNVVPAKNDGKTVHALSVKDVPVDGFWSISLYDAKGYYERNDLNAYSVNNVTAKKDGDGTVKVQFGGCDGKVDNCLPIMPGWNYMVRLYRPRAEILNAEWKFPEAQPVP
jgi:hypothetical protein